MERRLTILAADVVGYSRLMGEEETLALTEGNQGLESPVTGGSSLGARTKQNGPSPWRFGNFQLEKPPGLPGSWLRPFATTRRSASFPKLRGTIAPPAPAEIAHRITRADLLHLDWTEGVPGPRYRHI